MPRIILPSTTPSFKDLAIIRHIYKQSHTHTNNHPGLYGDGLKAVVAIPLHSILETKRATK